MIRIDESGRHMIRINLLPFRAARKQENVKRQLTVFILALVLVAVMLFFVHNWLGGHVRALEQKVEETNDELQIFKQRATKTDELQAQLDSLKRRNKIIADLKTTRGASLELLSTIPELVVKRRMWLTEMKVIPPDAENNRFASEAVLMSGISTDETTVAQFMKNIEGSELFQAVILQSLRAAAGEDMNKDFRRFVVIAQLRK
ncbi:MAG: PilN domain-containing protein [Desulfatibacillaceae bacterium]